MSWSTRKRSARWIGSFTGLLGSASAQPYPVGPGNRRRGGSVGPAHRAEVVAAPAQHREQDRLEARTPRRERVDDARRHLGEDGAGQDALVLEDPEALRQR